jgi:hypothetical protein
MSASGNPDASETSVLTPRLLSELNIGEEKKFKPLKPYFQLYNENDLKQIVPLESLVEPLPASLQDLGAAFFYNNRDRKPLPPLALKWNTLDYSGQFITGTIGFEGLKPISSLMEDVQEHLQLMPDSPILCLNLRNCPLYDEDLKTIGGVARLILQKHHQRRMRRQTLCLVLRGTRLTSTKDELVELCKEYPQLLVDISFTKAATQLERLMAVADQVVVVPETGSRTHLKDFPQYLTALETYMKMARDNPFAERTNINVYVADFAVRARKMHSLAQRWTASQKAKLDADRRRHLQEIKEMRQRAEALNIARAQELNEMRQREKALNTAREQELEEMRQREKALNTAREQELEEMRRQEKALVDTAKILKGATVVYGIALLITCVVAVVSRR